MPKEIVIPKKELRKLYLTDKLYISRIARFYNCSSSRVWSHLWRYGIAPNRCKEVYISKKDLKNLYLNEKKSSRDIAKKYNCGKSIVESELKKYKIPLRSKSEALKLIIHPEKYIISRKTLDEFYWYRKLSTYKIAEKFGCSPSAIFHKLIRFNIPRRSDVEGIILTNEERCKKISKAVTLYAKKDYDGSEIEKAYLIGFCLGDMNVSKRKYGETIYVSSCTTKKEQLDLMKDLFRKFGHINVNKSKKLAKNGKIDSFHFMANLNKSFDFLTSREDDIKKWIFQNEVFFLSFLGGYTDAEGSFGIYNNFGSYTLASYDKNIISKVFRGLDKVGISLERPIIRNKKGYTDKRGIKNHCDLWCLRIRRKNELFNFINIIEPYIKHAKRKRDLIKVKKHIALKMNYEKNISYNYASIR